MIVMHSSTGSASTATEETLSFELEGLNRDQLSCLQNIAALFSSEKLPVAQKLQKSLLLLLGEIKARQGSILVMENEDRQFKIVAAIKEKLIGMVRDVDPKTITGYVYRSQKPLLVKDITKDRRFKTRNKNYRTNSLMSVPFISREKGVIGIFHAADREDDESFEDQDLRLITEFTLLLTPILENVLLLEKMSTTKTSPDVLDDLFSNRAEITNTELQHLAEIIKKYTQKPLVLDLAVESRDHPLDSEDSQPRETGETGRQPKRKSTYYLSGSNFKRLNRAKTLGRNLAPEHLKRKVTKSGIVNAALELVLTDFEQNRNKSLLAKKLFPDPDSSS
jgi:hypothetical protein